MCEARLARLIEMALSNPVMHPANRSRPPTKWPRCAVCKAPPSDVPSEGRMILVSVIKHSFYASPCHAVQRLKPLSSP